MEDFCYGLRINIRNILSSVSEETVNAIIHAIRNAGVESLLDLQLVQEKDLMFILKAVPRRKLIKAWREPDMIEKRIKNEDSSQQIDEFLAESSPYPVKVESITELLKTNICSILNPLSEETLNDIIHALKDSGLELISDLKFVQEDDLTQVLEPMQRQKLIKAWSQQDNLVHFSSESTVVHEPTAVSCNTIENSSAVLSNASSSIPDLSIPAQIKQEYEENSLMDTSQSLPNQLSSNIDQKYGILPPGPIPGVSGIASISGENVHPAQLYRLLFQKTRWKRDKCASLLKAFARYKTELSCPSVKIHHVIWEKIADEVHQSSKCLRCFKGKGSKRCSYVSGSQCMEHIEELRLQYHTYKNQNLFSRKMAKFFDTARSAFETTENCISTFNKSSSSGSSPNFKWLFKKRLALLRLYTIYKTELSSSNIEEEIVWKKIAEEIGKRSLEFPDTKQCCKQICIMKCEYERQKHNEPYKGDLLEAVFLDEAENAFENIENPVVFSAESNLEKWAMSKTDHVILLQVYAKYKDELLLQNFNVENQIVWGKVSREVSEKCPLYYGKRRCCYEINNFRKLYEKAKRAKERNEKKKKKKKKSIPYFFVEAEKAFESTECTDQCTEVRPVKNVTVKQEIKREERKKRDWYTHIDI